MVADRGGRDRAPGPLTPAVFHILLALSDGPLHGYAIMRAVEETSGLRMGPGTVYGTIQRLEESGLVEQTGDAVDRRRTFRLMPAGRKTLRVEAARLARLGDLVRAKKLAPDRG